MTTPNALPVTVDAACHHTFDADTWLLALNSVSGGGRGLKLRSIIEARLHEQGQRFHTVVSHRAGQTADLVAESVKNGCRRILIAGGDGSFGEAVNGLFAQTAVAADMVTLALLPVGTGNDWARGHGVPAGLEAAIFLAVHGRAKPHDAGLIEFAVAGSRRWFVNVAGTGFDAAVVERMPSRRLGRLAEILRDIRRLFDGTLPAHPKVSCWRTTRVSLDGPTGTPIEADGEPVGHLPVEVSILPAALRVMLPE
jgi:diacylglycerol kinase family enzyme